MPWMMGHETVMKHFKKRRSDVGLIVKTNGTKEANRSQFPFCLILPAIFPQPL